LLVKGQSRHVDLDIKNWIKPIDFLLISVINVCEGDTAFSKFPNSYFYLVYSRETDTAEATIDDHCSFDEVGQEGGAGQGDVSGCKNTTKT
jgi:hypothetical protein